MKKLPAGEREGPRRKAKPESVWREAQGAAVTLAGEWQDTFDAFIKAGSIVPPAMIVVCDNTDLAKEIHAEISRSGLGFEELKNTESREQTIRIDTKLLGRKPRICVTFDASIRVRPRVERARAVRNSLAPGRGLRVRCEGTYQGGHRRDAGTGH